MRKLIIILTLFSIFTTLSAQNEIQWRGDRTGIYKETGLLKTWPADGLQLLWHFDGLGQGNSSVSINSDEIYVTGMTDRQGYLYVFNMDGKLRHKIEYGREFDNSYPGSRSAVMHDDGKLYIVSGRMEVFC
jgi:hypothetical protein